MSAQSFAVLTSQSASSSVPFLYRSYRPTLDVFDGNMVLILVRLLLVTKVDSNGRPVVRWTQCLSCGRDALKWRVLEEEKQVEGRRKIKKRARDSGPLRVRQKFVPCEVSE